MIRWSQLRWVLVLWGVTCLTMGCLTTSRPSRPTTPTMPRERAERECRDIWLQELRREIDAPALADCIRQYQAGVTGDAVRAAVRLSPEWKVVHAPAPPPPPIPAIRADGKIFRTETGTAWRWRGVSAFKLLDKFARGEDIDPFLDAYKGYNVLRVWPYVEGPGWKGRDWPTPPSAEVIRKFLAHVAARGWYVELTLLTDDKPHRIAWARTLLAQLAAEPRPTNLFIEIGNEPLTHKNIPTASFRTAAEASRYVYASGDYEKSARAFGDYLVHHSPRDSEWPRKAHDCLEFYRGGGPHAPTDPAHPVPCVLDEPGKPEDAKGHAGKTDEERARTKADDFRAYFGTAALLAAGATFHCETCKYAELPTSAERQLAEAALEGLTAFPASAPLGPYRRPQDASLRTYMVGPYMVRVRPTKPTPPEAGWERTGDSLILWKR